MRARNTLGPAPAFVLMALTAGAGLAEAQPGGRRPERRDNRTELLELAHRVVVAEAIDVLVFIRGRGSARRVDTIARVEGLRDGDYDLTLLAQPPVQQILQGDSNA